MEQARAFCADNLLSEPRKLDMATQSLTTRNPRLAHRLATRASRSPVTRPPIYRY